jgi:integrase
MPKNTAKRLTANGIEKIGPKSARQEIPDTIVPGLYFIVQPSGAKSWSIRARLHGKPIKYTIGKYPAYELGSVDKPNTARCLAQQALNAIHRGKDPRTIRNEERANTVKAVAAEWIKRDQKGNRRVGETERLLDRDVLPHIGDRPIISITKPDIKRLVDRATDRSRYAGTHLVSRVHRLFAWAVEADYIATNPVRGIKKPVTMKEMARDRVLADGELGAVWWATGDIAWHFGQAARLLILTGARLNEIAQLRWSEVDLETGTIALEGERTKTGAPHIIPLSAPALEIVKHLDEKWHVEAVDGAPSFVFTTTGRTPVSGWSRAKRQIDSRCPDMPAWKLHDLRRTLATGLQRQGTRLEVTEAVLGHTSGSRGGIVGVYQRHDWAEEKRAALEGWGRHVSALVGEGEQRNVVAFAR